MKKVLLVIAALALMGSVCYASSCGTESEGLVGKVAKVTIADPVTGVTSNSIEVVDATGKATVVTVQESAKVVDAALNVLTLRDLRANDTVAVKTTKDASGKEVASEISKK